jgi:hypothetical protein
MRASIMRGAADARLGCLPGGGVGGLARQRFLARMGVGMAARGVGRLCSVRPIWLAALVAGLCNAQIAVWAAISILS